MSRITRKKAAELAEALHIDEDAALEIDDENVIQNAKDIQLSQSDRAPLGPLEPNSADNHSQSDDATQEMKKSTRSGRKGAKQGGKGKKNQLAASTATTQSELSPGSMGQHEQVLPDEHEATPSPASEKAAEDLMRDVSSEAPIPVEDAATATAAPASNAVKLTRSQLAKYGALATEPKSLVDGLGQLPEERGEIMPEDYFFPTTAMEVTGITSAELMQEDETAGGAYRTDLPVSPLPNAVPKVVAHLRTDTPAKRSTSNKENIEPEDIESPQPSTYDVLEDAAVTAATPQPTVEQEDPIAALDNLDDAVENINKDIPDVQTSPEKPKSKKEGTASKASKKPAPVVRATKASQARISLAQNPDAAASKAPALGRPRPSMTLGRSTSVRQTSTSSSQLGNSTSKRIPSASSAKDPVNSPTAGADGEKKAVVIPHSKPRPVSISFPAPPQPVKSTKAPTRSSFQLPGDAVAAKLKAAREARMLKESEEEEKKRTAFKARPVPSFVNGVGKGPNVRQTNASRARESIMNGRSASGSASGASASASASASAATHRRAQSVAISNPSAANKARLFSASTSSRPTPSTSTTTTDKPASGPTTKSTPLPKHRPSTSLATLSKPRPSLLSSSTAGPSSQQAPVSSGKGTAKGKEVFNRAATAKAVAEREKMEKEAAAKKARLDAAERGRKASREWAEGQARKKAAAAAAAKKVEEDGVGAGAGLVAEGVEGSGKVLSVVDGLAVLDGAVTAEGGKEGEVGEVV